MSGRIRVGPTRQLVGAHEVLEQIQALLNGTAGLSQVDAARIARARGLAQGAARMIAATQSTKGEQL